MIRLEAFDCLNPHKRKILRLLKDREFNLREICEGVEKSRSNNYNALLVLERAGLVVQKKGKKKHFGIAVKNQSRDVVLWGLTENGKYALEYFCEFEKGGLSG